MKILASIIFGSALLCAQTAFAGMPYEEETVCPVGGETFKTTSTMSCSTMGRMISLQPVTSCDFVTHLPQCPSNKLPIFKEFTEDDLVEIKAFMKTKKYKDARKKSHYYLASIIENSLSSRKEDVRFVLLQKGLWFEPKASYGSPEYMAAYHKAAEAAFASDGLQDVLFWRGAEVFSYIHSGDLDQARKHMVLLKQGDVEPESYLAKYVKALDYCLDNPKDEKLCTSYSRIRDHAESPSEK